MPRMNDSLQVHSTDVAGYQGVCVRKYIFHDDVIEFTGEERRIWFNIFMRPVRPFCIKSLNLRVEVQ